MNRIAAVARLLLAACGLPNLDHGDRDMDGSPTYRLALYIASIAVAFFVVTPASGQQDFAARAVKAVAGTDAMYFSQAANSGNSTHGTSEVLHVDFVTNEPFIPKAVPDYLPESMEGPSGIFMASQSIAMGLYMRGVDVSEQQSTQVLGRRSRMASGSWELAAMYDGFHTHLPYEKDWDETLRQLQKWRAAYPNSRTAPVAEATFWIAYAQHARGGDYAYKVPEMAWELYRTRLARAREVLEGAKDPGNPHWYTQMLYLAYTQDTPADQRVALFEEAIRAEPYYYTHYFVVANQLTPRWGGSLAEFQSFVEASVKRTSERDGATMYARLYWILASVEHDREPFTELGIPWPKMRQGFDDLMQRYPNSQWNLNNYAYFACRAKDERTFGRIVGGIQQAIPPAWNGAYTLDYCKNLLLKKA